MRVIAGEYRRRTLVTARGTATRPTTDRLRETLFNVLAPRLPGARFLDLYAGSGANGIEALSRGAALAVFVERAAPALGAIRANLAALDVAAAAARLESQAVQPWLQKRATLADHAPFDILFLDPPYDERAEYEGALDLLGAGTHTLIASGGIVVAEHRRGRRGAASTIPGDRHGTLLRQRLIEQGDAALSFYSVAELP